QDRLPDRAGRGPAGPEAAGRNGPLRRAFARRGRGRRQGRGGPVGRTARRNRPRGVSSPPQPSVEHAMNRGVDLNSDMGESFAAWKMGDDEAMLKIVTSANVACGFHAGDPNVMAKTAAEAKQNGVDIGAHPGFNDLAGFGRRQILGDSPAEIERMIAYQIGALQAVATLVGHKVAHVKAHGALSNMAAVNEDLARSIARAIRAVDRDLLFVVMPMTALETAGDKEGLKLAREIF